MNWSDLTGKYHEQTFAHNGRLSSLPEEWQRKLAALWRLEADVNNGAYLQFLTNWGRESYEYASRALKKMGALKMASIIDRCQALVDEHVSEKKQRSKSLWRRLLPNRVMRTDGTIIKEAGSDLPDNVLDSIYELSYEFMAYPESLEQLGLEYYGRYIDEK